MGSITYVVDPKTSPKRVTIKRADITEKKNTTTTYPTVGKQLLLVSDLKSGKFSLSNFIIRPRFITPLDNSTGYVGDVTITKYSASPTFRGTHSKTIIELGTDKNFTTIINRIETTTDITTAKLLPTTSKAKNYLRARHISGQHMSDWSDTITVEVAQLEYIAKPTILSPANNTEGVLVKYLYIETSNFAVIGASDAVQEYTEYQISTNNTFTNVIKTEYVRQNMTEIIISDLVMEYGTYYYIRVRYKGSKYGTSEWSDTVRIKTIENKVDLGIDGLDNKLAGNDLDGAYYGELVVSKLTNTNFRGPYRNTLTYTAGMTVKSGTVKYKALLENVNKPVTNTTYWKVDTDNYLPKMKWLLDEVGVGYGFKDDNIDGMSNGGAVIGNIANENTTWLKFTYNEKLLYIAKKPIVLTIAWNDLAKRYLVNRKRTIKIGTRLYYIRLLTEEEYNGTLVSVTNGTLGTLSTTDLDLDRSCWITDSNNTILRKTIKGYDINKKGIVSNVDAKSRTVAYRPVLELINIGDEPYKKINSLLPIATNELFKYDEDTDTGYFGKVPYNSLIDGSSIANQIGLSIGTQQNIETPWLKFYWHGMVLYTTQKPIRYGLIKEDLLSLNSVFGITLSNNINKYLTVRGIKLNIGLLTGAGKAPSAKIESSGDPLSKTNFTTNVRLEIGKGSMWNELIYRVCAIFVDDVLENQDTLNYVELHGGVQIGDNWDTLGSSDLGIASGNGSNAICQEVSNANPLESISRGYYFLPGIVRQAFNQRLEIFGWRPILIEGE